jgi:hypothetical protein
VIYVPIFRVASNARIVQIAYSVIMAIISIMALVICVIKQLTIVWLALLL